MASQRHRRRAQQELTHWDTRIYETSKSGVDDEVQHRHAQQDNRRAALATGQAKEFAGPGILPTRALPSRVGVALRFGAVPGGMAELGLIKAVTKLFRSPCARDLHPWRS